MHKYTSFTLLFLSSLIITFGEIAGDPQSNLDLTKFSSQPNFTNPYFDEDYDNELLNLVFNALMQQTTTPSNLENINLIEFIKPFVDQVVTDIDMTSQDILKELKEVNRILQKVIPTIPLLFENNIITSLPTSLNELIEILKTNATYTNSHLKMRQGRLNLCQIMIF